MKIAKPQRVALLHRPYEHLGAFHFGVTAAVYFPFRQPGYLLPEIAMWKIVAKELGKDAPLDLCIPKPRSEVLVIGKAFATPGSPAGRAEVRLTVGAPDKPLLDKRLAVFGDRHWTRGVFGIRPSDPLPFTEMPIDWAHAFGGDGYPQNPLGKGAAPLAPAKDGTIVHPLPNIEDPLHLIIAPEDRPPPAGFGPLDFIWPQRAAKAGTYDQAWLDNRFPGFADDIDMTMFNSASPDQWLKQPFSGDDRFSIAGMNPEAASVQGALPAVAMRCLVDQRTGGGLQRREIPMRAETLWLFPHLERAIVVFRGNTTIGTDDATDIVNLLIAAEAMAAPRPFDHYAAALDVRLDPKQGAQFALRDDQLLPELPARTAPLPEEANGEDWIYAPKGLMYKRMRVKMERDFANARAQFAQAREKLVEQREKLRAVAQRPGMDARQAELDKGLLDIDDGIAQIDAGIVAMVLPPEEPPVTLEELPALKKRLVEQGKKAQDAGKVKLAEAEQKIRESLATSNAQLATAREKLQKIDTDEARAKLAEMPSTVMDYDQAKADGVRKAGGPPKPMAPPMGAQLREADAKIRGASASIPARAREAAAADPASDAAARIAAADEATARGLPVDIPKFEAQLKDNDARIAELYRKNAHMMLPAMAMEAADSARAREQVAAAHAAKRSLAGIDLTGADLSRMNLRGIDLSQALLESADLSGSDLGEANLEGAVLARTRLVGTRFDSANLAGANLGLADLTDAQFMGAALAGAKLSNAMLAGASFEGADLTKAELLGAHFAGANFTRAKAPQANFLNVDLSLPDEPPSIDHEPGPAPELDMRGALFAGADLHEAKFVNCIVAGIDFSGANLSGAVFLSAKGDGCRFQGAEMTNVRFVLECSFADCDFSGARVDKMSARGCNLANGNFEGCSAVEADFTGSNLARADFRQALARGARFAKADLTLADMRGINLMDGILQKAVLNGTRLSGANLYGADLLRVVTDEGTDLTRTNMQRTLYRVARKQ